MGKILLKAGEGGVPRKGRGGIFPVEGERATFFLEIFTVGPLQ